MKEVVGVSVFKHVIDSFEPTVFRLDELKKKARKASELGIGFGGLIMLDRWPYSEEGLGPWTRRTETLWENQGYMYIISLH